MPVTNRAAALRSTTTDDVTLSLDQTTSAPTPVATSPSKTIRKCRSKQKQKQLKTQPTTTCSEPEVCSTPQHQSIVSKTESIFEVTNYPDHESNKLEKEIDISLENLSSNQEVIFSSSNGNKIIQQRINKTSTSYHSPNWQSTFSSPSSVQSTSTLVTRSPARERKNDHFTISLESSNNDKNDMYYDHSNAFMNVLVIKSDITTGTSTCSGNMIFMNGYDYFYMSTAKETMGWYCARRNENCKAVIHTFKRAGEFNHWNEVFHYHTGDLNKTRKREVLAKIKS